MDWFARIHEAAENAGHGLEPDIIDELAAHAESAYNQECTRGSTTGEADAHVARLIAIWVSEPRKLIRPELQPRAIDPPVAGGRWMSSVRQDVRYAVRLSIRQRAFSLLAISTMAIAIGVMTALFSVAYAVLLKPLPWVQADRLVRLTESHPGATRQMPLRISSVAYNAWRDHPSTIEDIGGWQRSSATLTDGADAERISVTLVTPSIFSLLRATPLLGRLFSKDDADEVVVSFGFWQERFGGDRNVLGRTLQLNGRPYTVVGVMPADFVFPDRDVRVWRPLAVPAANRSGAITIFEAMARLAPGATPAAAAAEATARARSAPSPDTNWKLAYFGAASPPEITVAPALDALTSDVRPGLVVMLIAVSLLLLTAVTNVAGLQLARATTRLREMAIRSAIGAGLPRLMQQLMIENIWLATAGGLVGLALSLWLSRLLPSLLPGGFPRADDIAFGWVVAGFALATTMATGILLGAVPAWQLRRLRLATALVESSTGAIGASRALARTAIMTTQISLTCALLVGATLLTRSFLAMVGQDRGYQPAHALTATLMLPDFAFTREARVDALHRFVEIARALPGHPIVAVTTGLPLSGSENITGFDMPSVRNPGTKVNAHAVRSVVTPDIFAALGLHLADGRLFEAADDSPSAPRVVVVNALFARTYLSGHPVGDHIRNFMDGDNIPFEIIGVVDDIIHNGLRDQTQPEIYSLLSQSPRPAAAHEVVLRTSGDPAALVQPLRSLARQISPAATIQSVRTMEDRVEGSLTSDRLYAIVVTVFGASALMITAVGLFSVLSYVVSQRTREIAVRSALGARPRQVAGLVFSQGLTIALGGLTIGTVSAWLSTRYLGAMLYGVSSHDGLTFTVVAAVILVVALVACLVPAIRATRVNPVDALRM